MKTLVIGLGVAALAVAGMLNAAAFQEPKKASAGAAQEQGMPTAQPTPFHKHLEAEVGTWDASIKMGSDPAESKGTEIVAMGPGGLWQVADFKGEMAGMAFTGHGVIGYDPAKQKYVGTWVDSMSAALTVMEGTADASGKVRTMTYQQTDPMSGQMMKYRLVTEMKDKDTRTFNMSATGPDGKEEPALQITYKRRKQ